MFGTHHNVVTVRRGAPWWVRCLGVLLAVALLVEVAAFVAAATVVATIVAAGVALFRRRRPRIVVVAPSQFGPVVTMPSRSVSQWRAWGARSRPAPAPAPVSLRKPPRGITTGR